MWFGTYSGLTRYDGYYFTNYFHDPKNSSSLSDDRIRFIHESKDKTLFIGLSYGGFCIYNRETDKFTRFQHNPNNANSISDDYVMSIFEDHNESIWIGTREGLDKFDKKSKTFTHYKPDGESDYFVSSISEDKQGNLWIYGKGDHAYLFKPGKNTFEKLLLTENYKNSFSRGGAIKYDSKGNLWIGTEGTGLFRYNIESGRRDWFSIQNKKLKSNIIFSIIEDSDGKIWVGTDGGGLYRYSYMDNSLIGFEHDPDDFSSLSGNGVYCVYESQPGVIWVGVFGAGLNIYKKEKKKFSLFSSSGKPGYCLSHKSVFSIKEAGDGKIWMGTDGGGLNLFDPRTWSFKYYTTKNSIIHSNIIKGIHIDKENNIWLGSYGDGLAKVNFEKGEIVNFKGDNSGNGKALLHDHVWDIAESYDKKIWLALLNFGVNVYDPEKEEFQYLPFDSAAFRNGVSTIYAVFEDSRKRMWVGSASEGLGYFDPDKKTFVRYKYESDKPGTISSNNIWGIFEDSQGNIWVATFKGGLNKLIDPEKGQFESYTMKDGLPTNNIKNIIEDDHRNLWLSTDKGITLFKVSERKFINFDIEDGLQSKEFNYRSALKTKDGYIYFGGIHGFNRFHPDSIRFNTSPPVVVLTDFKIFNKSIKPNENYKGGVYLKKPISLSREITLTSEFNCWIFLFKNLIS